MDTYIHRITATPPAYWDGMQDRTTGRRTVLEDADRETAADTFRFISSEGWRDIVVEAYKPTYDLLTDPVAWFAN